MSAVTRFASVVAGLCGSVFRHNSYLSAANQGYVITAVGMDDLQKMLVFEPSKRISAKAALSHAYFNDVDKTAV